MGLQCSVILQALFGRCVGNALYLQSGHLLLNSSAGHMELKKLGTTT